MENKKKNEKRKNKKRNLTWFFFEYHLHPRHALKQVHLYSQRNTILIKKIETILLPGKRCLKSCPSLLV